MDILNRLPRTSAELIAKYGDALLDAFGYDIIAINDYDTAAQKGLLELEMLNGLLADKMVRIANYTRSKDNRIEVSIELTPLGFSTKTGALTRKINESARYFQDESQGLDEPEPESERQASSASTVGVTSRLPAGISGSSERSPVETPTPATQPLATVPSAGEPDLGNGNGNSSPEAGQNSEAASPMVWPIGGVSSGNDSEEQAAGQENSPEAGDVLELGGSGDSAEWQGQARSADLEIPEFLRRPRDERL